MSRSITRRDMMGAGLAAGAALALSGCAASTLRPGKRLIVDAQVHLWQASSAALLWLPNVPPQMPEVIGQVERLARHGNVSVKLSAAPNWSTQPYPFQDFREPIQRLFNAFGPLRCHWGTDITNGFARATYRQRATHFKEALDFLSESDKDWVMCRALLARLNWT